MARRSTESERVAMWQGRITSANKVYADWEEKYECDRCQRYYEGFQWDLEIEGSEHYTVNMVFPTVEVKIPSLMFYRPHVKVKPQPSLGDDPGSDADARAKLQEDTLNTFIGDRKLRFKKNTHLALKESFWRFGVIEIGYTADYIDNPNVGKPALKDDNELTDSDGNKVVESDVILRGENLFVRRIPAKHFRVPMNASNDLEECDWYSYYEYHYIDDVKRNPKYSNTKNLKPNASVRPNFDSSMSESDMDWDDKEERISGLVKLWKLWDLRTKKRYVFLDSYDKFLLDGDPFEYSSCSVLKYHERTDEFYPIPPIYNWLSLQDELNETRDMQRIHRKRFYRRYLRSSRLKEEEWNKIEGGGDGVCAEVEGDPTNIIVPVPDAPLDPAIVRNIPQTKEDFREISGIGSEQRGEADPNVTATQANIVQAQFQIRENFGRTQVADWLTDIVINMLKTIRHKMALEFWVKRSVDLQGPNAAVEAVAVAQIWQKIKNGEALGVINNDVAVEVESLSPVAEVQDRTNFFQGLGVIANPQIGPLLLASPTLLRKALGFFNIRAASEIAEIQKAVTLQAMAAAAQAAQKSGQSPSGAPGLSGLAAPGPTPQNTDIQGQLQAQMGGVQ